MMALEAARRIFYVPPGYYGTSIEIERACEIILSTFDPDVRLRRELGDLYDAGYAAGLTHRASYSERITEHVISVSLCIYCGNKHVNLHAEPTGNDALGAFDCWQAKCPTTGKMLYQVFESETEHRRRLAQRPSGWRIVINESPSSMARVWLYFPATDDEKQFVYQLAIVKDANEFKTRFAPLIATLSATVEVVGEERQEKE